MNLVTIRVLITIMATFTAITFIALSYIFPEHSVFILTIEVILLPTLYIIGNYFAESLIEKEYVKIIDYISDKSEQLNERYNNERFINISLKKRGEISKETW